MVAVYGSQGADSFVVSDVAVSVLGQTVAVVVEAVEVEGLAGEDVFTVTAGAVPIAVVGGDPIGVSAGDRLLLAGPGGRWCMSLGRVRTVGRLWWPAQSGSASGSWRRPPCYRALGRRPLSAGTTVGRMGSR